MLALMLGAAAQSVGDLNAFKTGHIVIPAATAGLAIVVIWRYDLTEEKVNSIKQTLIERRGDI